MQGFQSNVDGFYDVGGQLPRYLRALADGQFADAEAERTAMDSAEAVRKRRESAQEYFFDALGGLPETDAPLNAELTGTVERDGYTIEKVIFESLPGFHVTTNCYVPNQLEGEVPGILFFCGHSGTGKAADVYQRACIEIARAGMVALAVDPIGQGERHQFYDPETGELPRENIFEHTYLGHQCQIAGTNLARYFVADEMRAFDYLASRPEVDASKIGATGNSGGGTQTFFLMLADDRLSAAVPCCSVTSKEDYMKTGQAQDGEQIVWGAIEHGPRYDDFVSTFAPKPVLIGAAQSDFLCVEGAYRTYERARSAYEQFGAVDAVDIAISDSTHGLSPTLREAMVNWFLVYLHGKDATFETNDPEVEDVETLWCTPEGEVNAAYPDERHVVDFTRAHLDSRTDDATPTRERIRERFDLDRPAPRRFPRKYDAEERDGLVREKIFFRSESDIVTTGIVVRWKDAESVESTLEPTLVLLERGTDRFDEYEADIDDLARECGAVLVFDPRGVGAVRSRDVNTPLANGGEYYDYHGTEYKLASDALMLGTSLVGLRTFDVLHAVGYLRDRFDTDTVSVVGEGSAVFPVLYAAVADETVSAVTVDDVRTFRDRATTEEITVDHGLTAFDVAHNFDVPDLRAVLESRGVDVTRRSLSDSL